MRPIEEHSNLNELLKPSLEDEFRKMIAGLEEGNLNFPYKLSNLTESSGGCKTLSIQMDEALDKMIALAINDSLAEDGFEINFKQSFQKKFEDLFYEYLKINRYLKQIGREAAIPHKIKWNQINAYLNGEKSIGTLDSKVFNKILMEFIEGCKIKAFDFRDRSLAFISKVRLLSLKKAVSMIQNDVAHPDELKYLRFFDSWPMVKVAIHFEKL